MPKTIRFWSDAAGNIYREDYCRKRVREQVKNPDLSDADADALLEGGGEGKWDTILVRWPFLREMAQQVETAIIEWDAARKDYFRNANRYQGALIAVAVEDWTLTYPQGHVKAGFPVPRDEAGFGQLPETMASAVADLVAEVCYPLSNTDFFGRLSERKPNDSSTAKP